MASRARSQCSSSISSQRATRRSCSDRRRRWCVRSVHDSVRVPRVGLTGHARQTSYAGAEVVSTKGEQRRGSGRSNPAGYATTLTRDARRACAQASPCSACTVASGLTFSARASSANCASLTPTSSCLLTRSGSAHSASAARLLPLTPGSPPCRTRTIPAIQYYFPDTPLLSSYHTNLAMCAPLDLSARARQC